MNMQSISHMHPYPHTHTQPNRHKRRSPYTTRSKIVNGWTFPLGWCVDIPLMHFNDEFLGAKTHNINVSQRSVDLYRSQHLVIMCVRILFVGPFIVCVWARLVDVFQSHSICIECKQTAKLVARTSLKNWW